MKGKTPAYITTKGEKAMNRYNEFAQFRKNILVLRNFNGYTLEDIGEQLGIRPTRVNDYELGRCHPNFEEIRILAKFYNLTIDALMYSKPKLTFEND